MLAHELKEIAKDSLNRFSTEPLTLVHPRDREADFDLTGLGTEEVKSDVTDQSPMTALSYRELEPGLRSTKVDAVKALDELKRVVSRLGSPGLKAEDLRV